MPDLVFFYGTLLDGFDGRRLAGVEGRVAFVARGSIRAGLFDLGEYPAAVSDKSRRVEGEIYRMIDAPGVLAALDGFEEYDPGDPDGSLYTRLETDVSRDDGPTVRAWVYLYNRPLGDAARIESGNYRRHVDRPGRS